MTQISTIMAIGSMTKNMELVSITLKEASTMDFGSKIREKERTAASNYKMGLSTKEFFQEINL